LGEKDELCSRKASMVTYPALFQLPHYTNPDKKNIGDIIAGLTVVIKLMVVIKWL
jgi:hypothetical protein